MEYKWNENMIEWGEIYCPMTGRNEMTYYHKDCPAFDSYTQLMEDEDGGCFYYRYDHDEGCWEDNVIYGFGEEDEE